MGDGVFIRGSISHVVFSTPPLAFLPHTPSPLKTYKNPVHGSNVWRNPLAGHNIPSKIEVCAGAWKQGKLFQFKEGYIGTMYEYIRANIYVSVIRIVYNIHFASPIIFQPTLTICCFFFFNSCTFSGSTEKLFGIDGRAVLAIWEVYTENCRCWTGNIRLALELMLEILCMRSFSVCAAKNCNLSGEREMFEYKVLVYRNKQYRIMAALD